MTMEQRIERLGELFKLLRQMMAREGEDNWVTGVNLILAKLDVKSGLDDSALHAVFQSVQQTYRSMVGGADSFSDFHIWRDDFNERKRENEQLSRVLDEIWYLLS